MKLALILAALCLSAVAHAADPKVGFIDKDRVVAESAIGKKLRADSLAFGAQQQSHLSAASAAATRARGTKDEERQLEAANAALNDANQAIKQHNEELDAALMKEVRGIARKLAQEQKLDYVDLVVYHIYARNDLTDAVIARLDAETYGASEKLHAEKEAAEKKLAEKDSTPPPAKDAPKK